MYLLCYCGNKNYLEAEDFNFSEYECSSCCATLPVPETEEEINLQNTQIRKEVEELNHTGRVRIMAIQETGEECCLRVVDKLDEELIDLLLAGYALNHPEWRLFTEPEINQEIERNLL